MAELKWRLVGTVIHYYSKLSVAIIELTDTLLLGDRISIEGYTTDLMQTVDSMQIEHKNVETSFSGRQLRLKFISRSFKRTDQPLIPYLTVYWHRISIIVSCRDRSARRISRQR